MGGVMRIGSIERLKAKFFAGKMPLLLLLAVAAPLTAQRVTQDFNSGWRFTKGEQNADVAQPGFDDSGWESVRLPHDWAISGPFDQEEHGFAAKLPWKGAGWYRKSFTLDGGANGKRVYLDFGGVMAFPKVYVNGQLAGEWDYGYMSFRIDATPHVKFGGKNVVAVFVDTRKHGTRWYPGAGIYRKVTLTIAEPVHLGHWSTFVTTPAVSDESATVRVQSVIENHSNSKSSVAVSITILDPKGQQVSERAITIAVDKMGSGTLDQEFLIPNPKRWDVTQPNLYSVEIAVGEKGRVVDSERTTFGIRTFRFTADDGFYLNGRRLQLYGVNLHHDHGPLGAAFYIRAMERQLEIMRDMGCNAIRTSHNPPSPELLTLCDEMGLVVWNELFDKWDDKADRVDGQPPFEPYVEKQARNFIMRDRNHPSIITWSIGNEIGNQPWDKEGKSPERVKFLYDVFLKYDPTRPIGLGCHIPGTVSQPIIDSLDLTGWNYSRRYARAREVYPEKPIIYSESASALSTRGFYELPLPQAKTDFSETLQVNSYDHNAAPWSDIADAEFYLMERDHFVAGEFVWTGFDYLGEPTPFSREARSSYFGIVDLVGIPKDRFYLYRSHWRPDETTIHILPHWNWPDRAGKNVPVYVYTNGDAAELFLNGKSLGKRRKTEGRPKVKNLAMGRPVTASSEDMSGGYPARNANDGTFLTGWHPSGRDPGQWWQVDLEQVQTVSFIDIEFENAASGYQYAIKSSKDGASWEELITKNEAQGELSRATHQADAEARYLRLEFADTGGRRRLSMREFGVYNQSFDESSYFAIMDRYRLRWPEVTYEPGELKVVAYKAGKKIGEAAKKTAGPPAKLRLTADRDTLAATGDDLCYVLVEALDEKNVLAPLADNLVRFEIDGPATIAGVGNGNPISYEPFQANERHLFYGNAMLILRTIENKGGAIQVRATASGMLEGAISLRSEN
jgi:beta-galactosidase